MCAANNSLDWSLAKQILEYFLEHPQAADTIEGIAQWWLQDAQLQQSHVKLAEALNYLVAEQLLVARKGKDGRISYSMNHENMAAITSMLGACL